MKLYVKHFSVPLGFLKDLLSKHSAHSPDATATINAEGDVSLLLTWVEKSTGKKARQKFIGDDIFERAELMVKSRPLTTTTEIMTRRAALKAAADAGIWAEDDVVQVAIRQRLAELSAAK